MEFLYWFVLCLDIAGVCVLASGAVKHVLGIEVLTRADLEPRQLAVVWIFRTLLHGANAALLVAMRLN